MKADYSLGFGFKDVILSQTDSIADEVLRGDTRLRLIAETEVYKSALCSTYERLVSNKELKPLEEQDIEYKRELWELAKQFLPEDSEPLQVRFCRAIMGFLWLLNN